MTSVANRWEQPRLRVVLVYYSEVLLLFPPVILCICYRPSHATALLFLPVILCICYRPSHATVFPALPYNRILGRASLLPKTASPSSRKTRPSAASTSKNAMRWPRCFTCWSISSSTQMTSEAVPRSSSISACNRLTIRFLRWSWPSGGTNARAPRARVPGGNWRQSARCCVTARGFVRKRTSTMVIAESVLSPTDRIADTGVRRGNRVTGTHHLLPRLPLLRLLCATVVFPLYKDQPGRVGNTGHVRGMTILIVSSFSGSEHRQQAIGLRAAKPHANKVRRTSLRAARPHAN